MSKLTSWLEIPEDSDFSIYNLPFGIFSTSDRNPRAGIAIGNYIIDLFGVAETGALDDILTDKTVLDRSFLNDFIVLGKPVTRKVRTRIQEWLCIPNSPLKGNEGLFVKREKAKLHLPVRIGDYTDFYSSIEHATNVGKMFRDPDNALLPNWRHLPVGYHGRASSIMISGTPVKRPSGQVLPTGNSQPIFRPSARLDFELEMAFVIGKSTKNGESIPIEKAEDHIFGMVLFNDWSARDIQKWEYVPLGPFLGKSFASSISPWIVTLEALEPFRVNGPVQQPAVLPYLKHERAGNFDIDLEVGIAPNGKEETIICRSNFKYMYWNMAQQLAHHTINGCNVNVGDMMASGTISGREPGSYGSMLELSWAGTKPLRLLDGSERAFIQDHDVVNIRGYSRKQDIRVGFGTVSAKVLP